MKNSKKEKYIKGILVLALITALSLNMVGCSKVDSEIVAKVNEEVITKEDIYNILVAQSGEQLVETLINEIIINSEAQKAEIEVSEEEVQAELDKLIEAYGGEEAFKDAITYYGYDVDEMKKNINMNFKIKRLLEPRVEITDEEIEEYFDENRHEFIIQEQVKASHILVREENEANEIYSMIEDGEKFEDLAVEYSVDGSSIYGGDLGYFSRGEMVKEFEDTAFSLDIDEISRPIKSEFGYHIIKVFDKIEEKTPKLEDYKELIRDKILEENIPYVYNDWYDEIIGDYKIENKLVD
ncbi:MAG: peptidylprolyl isomerase [Tissierellaceae bacterium]|nr:peptidylprolyl isomerase [Tissierellaceae bacterium]